MEARVGRELLVDFHVVLGSRQVLAGVVERPPLGVDGHLRLALAQQPLLDVDGQFLDVGDVLQVAAVGAGAEDAADDGLGDLAVAVVTGRIAVGQQCPHGVIGQGHDVDHAQALLLQLVLEQLYHVLAHGVRNVEPFGPADQGPGVQRRLVHRVGEREPHLERLGAVSLLREQLREVAAEEGHRALGQEREQVLGGGAVVFQQVLRDLVLHLLHAVRVVAVQVHGAHPEVGAAQHRRDGHPLFTPVGHPRHEGGQHGQPLCPVLPRGRQLQPQRHGLDEPAGQLLELTGAHHKLAADVVHRLGQRLGGAFVQIVKRHVYCIVCLFNRAC